MIELQVVGQHDYVNNQFHISGRNTNNDYIVYSV